MTYYFAYLIIDWSSIWHKKPVSRQLSTGPEHKPYCVLPHPTFSLQFIQHIWKASKKMINSNRFKCWIKIFRVIFLIVTLIIKLILQRVETGRANTLCPLIAYPLTCIVQELKCGFHTDDCVEDLFRFVAVVFTIFNKNVCKTVLKEL